MQLLPAKRRGLGVWEPLTLLTCKQFRLLRAYSVRKQSQ